MTAGRSTRQRAVLVLCPHFEPDTAPTGTVMTRIVKELAERGRTVHVVSSLPWYRHHSIESGWGGRLVRRELTEWGSITRVHPFPGDDRRNLLRRAFGFLAYSLLVGWQALRVGRSFSRAGAVIAMSPPLTLGLTGWIVARVRRAPLVFNIQDVFPDAAVETGAVSNRAVIGLARVLERWSYRAADVVTVLSEDLRDNVAGKLGPRFGDRVRVIPNFVDTDAIVPQDRLTAYRRELGLGDGPIVLYAGNVGFSQSLELLLGASRELPDVQFLINGEGAARSTLEVLAEGLPNVHFGGYLEPERLCSLLATGDIHVVTLKRGLGRVSVPSKAYSIMAAGRPIVASIDPDTAIPRILDASGAGLAVPPDDVDALVGALRQLLDDPSEAAAMGRRGRHWVERGASPGAVGDAYDQLLSELSLARVRRHGRGSAGAEP